jgi:hypothetical protein
VASGPYADHHLLCVNGAMTGTEGLRRGATEFPPMRHSSAPYFSVSARNQTAATNRQFLSFQQKSAARTGGPVARQGAVPPIPAVPLLAFPTTLGRPLVSPGFEGCQVPGNPGHRRAGQRWPVLTISGLI